MSASNRGKVPVQQRATHRPEQGQAATRRKRGSLPCRDLSYRAEGLLWASFLGDPARKGRNEVIAPMDATKPPTPNADKPADRTERRELT